jgi:HAD superfamily hydrolase (TIGR01509 family)
MIDAIVFDFDGVWIDTERAVLTAVVETFRAYGADLTEAEFAEGIGSHWDEWGLQVERARLPLPTREDFRGAMWARVHELASGAPVLEGVREWLHDAVAAGLKVAVASSSSTRWVHDHLERLGVREHFAVLSCCDRGGHPGKPAPDVYVAACDALAVPPSRALAVEDSAHGVAAAKSAGLWCVAVPTDLTAELDLRRADVRLTSLTEASLRDVIETIRERA